MIKSRLTAYYAQTKFSNAGRTSDQPDSKEHSPVIAQEGIHSDDNSGAPKDASLPNATMRLVELRMDQYIPNVTPEPSEIPVPGGVSYCSDDRSDSGDEDNFYLQMRLVKMRSRLLNQTYSVMVQNMVQVMTRMF